MDCRQAIEFCGVWANGELDEERQAAMDEHLAACAECRAAAERELLTDAELLRAFAPRRRAAARVAERVAAELRRQTSTDSPSARRTWSLIAAAVAGFLLAIGALRPWERPARAPRGESPIARLALATGAAEVRPSDAAHWLACSTNAPIDAGARVRTGPDVRCELDTSSGGRLRLDCDTEVRLDDSQQVELLRGQVWSNVKASKQIIDVQPARAAICARDAEFAVSCQPGEAVLTVVKGAATVRGPHDEQTVSAGEKAKIVAGVVAENRSSLDPLLDTSWVNALVCLKPPDDPELVERVNDILAQIGAAKLAYLYEDEIRRLGSSAALPLLRFIASDRSRADPARREIAARIVADLASWEAIGDLIELLADGSPAVRCAAAQALFRLTGRDHGYSLDQWRAESALVHEAGREAWRRWRAEERQRSGALPPAPAARPSPPPFSKARVDR